MDRTEPLGGRTKEQVKKRMGKMNSEISGRSGTTLIQRHISEPDRDIDMAWRQRIKLRMGNAQIKMPIDLV